MSRDDASSRPKRISKKASRSNVVLIRIANRLSPEGSARDVDPRPACKRTRRRPRRLRPVGGDPDLTDLAHLPIHIQQPGTHRPRPGHGLDRRFPRGRAEPRRESLVAAEPGQTRRKRSPVSARPAGRGNRERETEPHGPHEGPDARWGPNRGGLPLPRDWRQRGSAGSQPRLCDAALAAMPALLL